MDVVDLCELLLSVCAPFVPPRGPLPRPCIKVDIQAAVRKFVFQVYIVKTKVYTGLEVCWTLAIPNNAETEFSGLMCLNVGNWNWQNPIYSVSKKVFCKRKTDFVLEIRLTLKLILQPHVHTVQAQRDVNLENGIKWFKEKKPGGSQAVADVMS